MMEQSSEPIVVIADDGMSASLVLPEPFLRSTLTAEMCRSLLQQDGVAPDAIDAERIKAYIHEATHAEPGRFEAVLAEATPAVDGIDAYVEWLIDQPDSEDEDEPTPDPDQEDEPVCFYSQCVYTVIKAGDVLGRVHQEVVGTDGRDVLGNPLVARETKPLELTYDESIQLRDNEYLVAQSDGVLIHDHTTAWVSDTLEIEESIDFSTGNIDFPGNVLIKQGVKDCFTVRATGDIEIRGLIEAANIICEQDLRSSGGFAGREQGTAEVGGSLHGKYLDAVKAQVDGDLCVEREIINCECTVRGNIDSPRGQLIGGCAHVTGTVELSELGASAQPYTELHVGVLPVLDPLIEQLTEFISRCIEERDTLFQEQDMIREHSGSRIAPTHQVKLDQIMQKMGRLQIELDRAEPSLQKARARAEAIRKIDVLVSKRVHPNAVLACGEHRYRIVNDIKGPVRITANKRGQLEYRQGEGQPRLLSEESEYQSAA